MPVWAAFERFELPSSFNPVGSGARALGMGGAFIAIADDATAASWNPAGLIQIRQPEMSIVGATLKRTEDNDFPLVPETSGKQNISTNDVNYFSLSIPCAMNQCGKNMIFSLNYQNLYNFDRHWELDVEEKGRLTVHKTIDYKQTGDLSPIGLAYAIQATETLSLGFTLNVWQNINDNMTWQQTYHIHDVTQYSLDTLTLNEIRKEKFTLKGINVNLGVFWHIYQQEEQKLTLGIIVKTPFTADIQHIRYSQQTEQFLGELVNTFENQVKTKEKIHLPLSYGLGLSYQFSDSLTVSGDIYKTQWQDFYSKDETGNKISPISNMPYSLSDVDATYQVRLGTEYRYISQKFGANYIIPFRAGIFYDPAPAEDSPDEYYGVSLGTGIAYNTYIFDIAYQYRWGNNVNQDILTTERFSQNIAEHTLYTSLSIRY
jgi:long-subunit fatty acid transport protein